MKNIPFSWHMRVSKRAKRPRITVNHAGRVELVWPVALPQCHVPSMLEHHQAWVLKHLERLSRHEEQQPFPPTKMKLHALQQIWHIHYHPIQDESIRIAKKNGALYVEGDVQDMFLLREALCAWVKQEGVCYLKPWLAEVAKEMGVSYQRVTIRLQKRRWGSCSAAKRINLNASLLFLPEPLVRHVLIHELAHLTHLNHSSAFWARVEQYDANNLYHRKLLRQHAQDVPVWLTEPLDAAACQVY